MWEGHREISYKCKRSKPVAWEPKGIEDIKKEHGHQTPCQMQERNEKITKIWWLLLVTVLLGASVPLSQVKESAFSSSNVWIWELDHKEGLAPKNGCFRTVMLEKILESTLDRKEIKPVNPQGNQLWIFIRRTDVEAEVPILRPPDEKSRLIRKDPDAGKDWSPKEKGTTEAGMVGWHYWLNGHEFEWTLGES